MTWLQNPIISYMYIWGWRDCIEALFVIIILYKITLWLNKDRTRNLVWYLYGYCILMLACYYLALPLIFTWLVAAAPVAAMVLLLMHQERLQKSFATPTRIIPAQMSTSWLDELLQASLIAMNSKKQIVCILEHQDTLNNLIATSYPMSTPCRKSVLLMLTDSSLFDQHAMVWISTDGILKGMNCTWALSGELTDKDNWTTALRICTKTDALAFKGNSERNSFDVVLRGNIIENLSSSHCRTVLLQYINKSKVADKNQACLDPIKEKLHETHRS